MAENPTNEPREMTPPVQFFDGAHRTNKAFGVTNDFRPNREIEPIPEEVDPEANLAATAEVEGEQLEMFPAKSTEVPSKGTPTKAPAPD